MSRRLLVMLIFIIIIRFKSKFMIYASTLNHIEDCFYEKRVDTSLNGYNDLHDRWISELDCLDRCLKYKPQRCRSFEHWHSNRHGLCVRANITLTDQPFSMGSNLFVDYYEIHCEKDTKAVRLQTITCPANQLQVLITLNGIDPNYVLLGDSSCKPLWSNNTHAQFIADVDNCSLILTDDSIVGKLRWEGVDKDTNEARQYERFFLCPSLIQQIRLAHWTLTTLRTTTLTTSALSISPTPRRLSSHIYDDQRSIPTTYRISLEWVVHNRTFFCPQICTMSLYSLVYVTLNDLSLTSSTFFIDSCDLIALHPYSNYLQARRLIYQGCSTDPTVIYLSSEKNSLSTFRYSFYLYNILKEPIPFEIQCKIFDHEQKSLPNQTNCSSLTLIDDDQLSINKKDSSYILFRSLPIDVTRQIPLNLIEKSPSSNSVAPMITVHHIECFLFAFTLLIDWTL